jgi:hypothetical protein
LQRRESERCVAVLSPMRQARINLQEAIDLGDVAGFDCLQEEPGAARCNSFAIERKTYRKKRSQHGCGNEKQSNGKLEPRSIKTVM